MSSYRYLLEFLWRDKIRRAGRDHFEDMLRIISELQGRDGSAKGQDEVLPKVLVFLKLPSK